MLLGGKKKRALRTFSIEIFAGEMVYNPKEMQIMHTCAQKTFHPSVTLLPASGEHSHLIGFILCKCG